MKPTSGIVGLFTAASLAFIFTADAGLANGSCNSVRVDSTFFEKRTNIYNHGGDHLAGEVTRFTVTGNFTSLKVEISGDQTGVLCSSAAACNGATFTAPADGKYSLKVTGTGGTQIAPPRTGSRLGIAGTVTSSCTAKTTGADTDADAKEGGSSSSSSSSSSAEAEKKKNEAARGSASSAAGSTSVASVTGALNSALSGGAPGSVTQNGLFLSTNGSVAMPKLWASIQGRNFDGTIDGSSREFTLGGDFEIGRTRLGLFLSSGRSDLDVNGVSVDAEGLSYGPYFKSNITDRISVNGYALSSKPEYTVGGTKYEATRRAFGLTGKMDHQLGRTQLTSHLSVSRFNEDHPAAGILAATNVSSTLASIGSRATFMAESNFRPYVSLGGDFHRYEDGVNGKTTQNSGRFGTGFDLDMGLGQLSLDIDSGRLLKGTRDVGVNLRFEMAF
ncbi:MAG: autotransporter outer membrane beta-barrel domain-containing protein [Pelagimonas sp.]|jgi:hypothetical protein|nr:autotransporter outer membrane beta-barrel domain-containing protein [Pelagimonas sp.]